MNNHSTSTKMSIGWRRSGMPSLERQQLRPSILKFSNHFFNKKTSRVLTTCSISPAIPSDSQRFFCIFSDTQRYPTFFSSVFSVCFLQHHHQLFTKKTLSTPRRNKDVLRVWKWRWRLGTEGGTSGVVLAHKGFPTRPSPRMREVQDRQRLELTALVK